jgi:hypothetical protein
MDATQNGPRLRTWRTITLGLHKSGDKYRNAMKSAGNKVGNWADIMLGKAEFSCASNPFRR